MADDLLPMVAAIFGAIETAARALRRRVDTPGRPARLQQRSIDCLGVAGLKGQVDDAGVFVVKEHALPFFSAVFGIENAALRIRSIGVAEGGNEDFFRVAGIHENPGNLPRILETNVGPAFAAIRGPVHAVPVGDRRAHVGFASAHVNDLRIGWGNRNGSDGSDGLRIENGLPGAASIVGAPHAATYRTEIENLGLTADSGDR